jgi:hypothetical protein
MNLFGMNTSGGSPFGDIYTSQANVYGNSFANPMNPANMNPGFGIDPNLLTPSYDAGYRPQYNGAQPYNQYGRVGFFAGINQFINPMAYDPRWGNPNDNQRQTVEGVASRPFDSVVWAGQRVAAPMAAFGLAFKYGAKPGMAMGNALGRGFANGMSAGMGGYMPNFVRAGISGVLGGGTLPAALGGMEVPGALGLAGSVVLPMIAGQALMYGVQKTMVDPYINTRRTARDFRDNFAGVTFGDSQGNVVTGQGLSYRESTRMGSQITRAGNNDFTFSSGEFANIADYSARAGLLDDSQSKQIVQRVKDIAQQVKLVMAIASDPSIKSAIEQLSKLHMAGASLIGGTTSQASQALMALGQDAAVAGRSVQNIMNTVGAQGQYMYQSNGLTPYLGQLAAANTLGSFENAKRMGLLNTSQLARMGGTEGATQAAMTAEINGSQTLLNKMAMYNQYINGRGGASGFGPGMNVTNVVSQFGSDFTKDTLGTYGGMHLYGGSMASKQLADRGSLALEDQVTSILDQTGTRRNKNGQYTAEQMAGAMSGVMGMSDDEIQAYVAQRAAETDSGVFQQSVKARNAQTQKQLRQYVTQNYLYGGAIGGTVRGALNIGHNLMNLGGDMMYDTFGSAQAEFGDEVTGIANKVQFGSTFSDTYKVSDMNSMIDSLTGSKGTKAPAQPSSIKLINEDKFFGGTDISKKAFNRMETDFGRLGSSLVNNGVMKVTDSRKVIARINQLAQSTGEGSQAARDFINATDKASKSEALGRLLKSSAMADLAPMINGTGGSDAARGNFDNLVGDTLEFGTHTGTVTNDNGTASGLQGRINQTLGIGDKTVKLGFLDSINAIGQISDIANKINNGASQQDVNDLLKSGDYGDVKKLIGNRTGKDASDYIVNSYKKAVGAGLGQIGYVAYNGGFNVDSFKKDPTKIQDKDERAKFIAAMQSNDTATIQNIVAKQLGMANGGQLTTQGLNGASKLDLKDVAGFEAQLDSEGMSNSKAYEKIASGRVDYATAQSIMNNLDTKKNNDKFGAAVDKFDKAADKIINGGDSTPAAPSQQSFMDRFISSIKTSSNNNQRPAGSPNQ